MEIRLRLKTETHFIEFEDSFEGWRKAMKFREENPQFRKRHISRIRQAQPKTIILEKLYEIK